MTTETNDRPRAFERHVQSLLLVVVAGLIGWAGMSISSTASDVAAMSVQIASLKEDLRDLRAELREQVAASYPRVQADTDLGQIHGRLDDHEARLRMLESRAGPR